MNAKIIITSLFLLIVQISFAQKKPLLNYEWFEEQSKIISDLQEKKTGLKADGYDITFAKDNFKVYFNDKLASQSYQFKKNDVQLVAIVEDVDFSKAIGLYEDKNIIYAVFPDNSITMQVYGHDQSNTVKLTSLDFYTNSDADRKKMFTTLYELIAFLKMDKGLMKTNGDWEKHGQEYQKLKPYEFYQKYPNSMLAYKGKFLEEDYDRQIRFANEFIKRYPIPSLRSESPNYRKTYEMSIKNKIKQGQNFISNVNVQPAPFPATINSVTYTILISKNYQLAQQKYDEIISELTKNFDREFIEGQDQPDQYFLATKHVFFYSRAGAIGKNIPFEKVRNVRSVSVYFDKQTYKGEEWYEVTIYFS